MKNTYTILGFFILILSFTIVGILNHSVERQYKLETPIASAGEITIITPENRTYQSPDSGFFPATYGFENDLVGSDPMEMNVFEGAGSVNVVENVGGHKRVIDMYDGVNNNHDELSDVIPLQTHGTVEFWIRSTDVTKANQFTLLDSNALGVYWQGIGWINLDGDNINYQDSTGWHVTSKTPYDNTWYHIKVEFECSTDSYQGLAQQTYRFYVDGEMFGDFSFKDNIDNVTQVYFFTRGEDYNYHCYVDALAYSWDSGYIIGDNQNEGLLLSYDNSTSLDWQGYSFDGQNIKTILGNKTIPMPVDGPHRIQVFGNNSIGVNYQSDLRHFYVGTLPENMEDWLYYREIDLSPSTPESNYQVKVKLYSLNFNYSKANPDGSDIRFLDQSQTLLSYWIEKWNDAGDSIVWVKVSTSGTSKIYMYYGNPVATSLSDGTKTFEFFDDFQGTSLNTSKWDTEIGNYCGISVSSGYVRLYSNAPNTFAEAAYFGFTDFYFNQGTHGWIHPSESITISLAEDTSWHTNEIRWTNLTSAPYYKNDVYVSEDTILEDTTLTVRFLAHSAYSGPGTPWGAWIWTDDNTLGQMGRGLRTKSWVDETGICDLRVDWVAVFKYSESNPSVTIGLEQRTGSYIIINAPIAYSLYGTTPPFFNINITDPDYNFTWYSLDGGSTNVYSNETSGIINQIEWDKQSNGTVSINFYANNSLGEQTHRGITVRKDILAPLITINTPTVDQVCGAIAPTFDLTIFEYKINTTWYTLDHGAINVSFSGSIGSIDQTEWAKKGGGTVTIRFYANDSLGNVDFSEVNVVKDLTSPVVSINSPDTFDLFGKSSPNFDITVTESNPDLMWYTLDSGATNVTFGGLTGAIDQTEWNKQGNGTVTIVFYARDEGKNEGYAEVIVRKEISDPIVLITDPLVDEVFGFIAPFFNVTVIEPDFDSMWYTLDDGINNVTATGFTGDISQTEWNKQSSGIVTIKFCANDTLGNKGYAEITIEKDVTDPTIQVNNPSDDDIFGDNVLSYDVSITEPNLDSMWYTLDNGATNIPIFSFTGTIDQIEWDKRGSGTVPIRFYANDTVGNIAYTEVLVTKDLIDPVVIIIFPIENDIFGADAPTYEISVTELNLDTMWYTLDNGLTNIPFSSLTGIISETEWDKKSSGDVTIKFYARDEAGNEDYAELIVGKDISIPLIVINIPEIGDTYGLQPPQYDLSVVEPNIDSMWYTLDNGITTTSFTEVTGTIDQTEWNKFGDGAVIIRFYVRDKGNNEAFAEVSVSKDLSTLTPDDPNPLPIIIPSIIIGVFALIGVTLIVYRKRIFSRNKGRRVSPKKPRKDKSKALGSSPMMFCQFCGAKLQKPSKFCIHCGVPLNGN